MHHDPADVAGVLEWRPVEEGQVGVLPALERADAAVDFVSMLSFVDRMQRAFFVDVPPAVPASSR